MLGLTSLEIGQHALLTLETQHDYGFWMNSILIVQQLILCYILYGVLRFFKNILAERIFVVENVQLAKRTSLLLFISAFLGEGSLNINGYSFFNFSFVITALVVWTLGKILEKANQIAEENEFTI